MDRAVNELSASAKAQLHFAITTEAMNWLRIGITREWATPSRLLICGAIFHLSVTILLCALGRSALAPATIDNNGIALSVASDGLKFLPEVDARSEELAHGQLRTWLQANSPLHVKLYSISFAAMKPFFGRTVLSAELANCSYYLAILTAVFLLGRKLFNRRAGLCGTLMVALWPSFLLHTTQLLRDPLFIAAMLGFMLANVSLLAPKLSWRAGLIAAAGGGLLSILMWLSRDTMREIVIATAALTTILLLVQQFVRTRSETHVRGWRTRLPALTSAALLLVLSVAATAIIPKFQRISQSPLDQETSWQSSRRARRDRLIGPVRESSNPWSRLVNRIGKLRQGFALEFSDAGSNVDEGVSLVTTKDVVLYLPRAALIGFLAPFPTMWFRPGNQISLSGRVLSGAETLALYLFEICALITLWKKRRQFSVWLMWLSAAGGLVALGLVVINVGALYRLRYVFAIIMIVIAAPAILNLLDRFKPAELSKP